MTPRAEVVVAGGGITGLAAALALVEAGRDVQLLEASDRFGGVIRTESVGGFLLEPGPDSLLAQKPEGLALCRAVGLGERLIPTNPHTRTVYVLRHGRLHAVPEGMTLAVPTRAWPFLRSGLFSWPGKLRMGLDLVLPRGGAGADESIASFLRRRFGREAVERLGEPLMAGIHAGDAERLSIRATFPRFVEMEARHRSLVRGMWASRPPAGSAPSAFYSLGAGMGALVEAVLARIPAARRRAGTPVTSLLREEDGYAVGLAGGGSISARAVVLAVPAPAAAPLLAPLSAPAAEALASLPFASSATVLLGYRRADVDHPLDGYGLLVPRGEGLRASACTFASTKLPGRAPAGHVLLRAFLGGVRDPEVLALDDGALASLARRELGPVLGLRGEPVLQRVYRWPRATPQMEVGHADRLARLERGLAGLPGLVPAGAGLRGTGLPDCIADGQRAAAAVVRHLEAGAPARAAAAPELSL